MSREERAECWLTAIVQEFADQPDLLENGLGWLVAYGIVTEEEVRLARTVTRRARFRVIDGAAS